MEKRRAWIELDMKHLAHNVAEFKRMLPEDCKMMPAVKANAYGHGASEMAGELQKLGIDAFCVASMEEGIELRRDGIKGEILVLGYTDPAAAKTLLDYQITQTRSTENNWKAMRQRKEADCLFILVWTRACTGLGFPGMRMRGSALCGNFRI